MRRLNLLFFTLTLFNVTAQNGTFGSNYLFAEKIIQSYPSESKKNLKTVSIRDSSDLLFYQIILDTINIGKIQEIRFNYNQDNTLYESIGIEFNYDSRTQTSSTLITHKTPYIMSGSTNDPFQFWFIIASKITIEYDRDNLILIRSIVFSLKNDDTLLYEFNYDKGQMVSIYCSKTNQSYFLKYT